MSRERIVLIGLAALVVLGLIFGGAAAARRNAWMEGYTMGRLTAAAGVDGALAPAAPYAPYAYAYPHGGPGFGGFFFLILGAGLIFFLFTRFSHMARWRAWAMQGGAEGEGRQGPPPWMQHHRGHGCWGEWAAEPTPPQQAETPLTPATEPVATPTPDSMAR